jgi:VanZ family protein
MRSPSLLALATLAALVLYPAVSLWPYQWYAARFVANGAVPLPGGGVRFASPGIALADGAPVWLAPALATHRLELSLRVRSLAVEQSGPARILTFSTSPGDSNLMVGQDGADLVLRLRTPWTDQIGTIGGEPVARLPDLFRTPAWADLRIIVEPGCLRIGVADEPPVERPLPRLPLANWDPGQRLALGNEVTHNRPWLGEIRRAVVSSGGRTADHAEAGRLEFPRTFLVIAESPKLVPLHRLNVRDAVLNVIFYLPLGFLLARLLGAGRGWRPSRVALGALFAVVAVSLSMEVLQIFLPRRFPSIDDLIFNSLGGGLGIGLALWAQRRRALREVLGP